MDIEQTKHLLLTRAALLMGVFILFALLVRPLLVEMDIIFTVFGLVNTTITFGLYFYLSRTDRRSWHAILMLSIFLILLFPLLLISGGVNSQFVALIPMIPMFFYLIGDTRVGRLSAVLLIALVIIMALLSSGMVDLTLEQNSAQKTYSRALWLCVACGSSAYLGSVFNRLTSKLTAELQQQASIDALTQVANRRSILEFLDLEVERQKQSNGWITVLMIDIDHFKTLNDRFGHLFGDRCLRQVAETLQTRVRRKTDALGRYGGEEFLMVLGGVDLPESEKRAEEVRAAIAAIQFPRGSDKASSNKMDNGTAAEENLILTATVGYCCKPSAEVNDIDELIKYADDALYLGKRSGRNQIVHFDGSQGQG